MSEALRLEVGVMQQRIDELETRVAFQEDSLQALDDVLAQQDALLNKQQLQLQLLAEKFKAVEQKSDQPYAPAAEERPPHY